MSEKVKTLNDILKAWPATWQAFIGAFDTPVDRRSYEKEPKDIFALDAVKRMRSLHELMKLATEQGAGESAVWFVTVFDEASMERKRAFKGKRPANPFIEPSMDDDTKVEIARIRDDGVKLYHSGPNIGFWFKGGGDLLDREEAHTRLERLEWAAGDHGYYGHTSSRCFGMYFSEEDALAAVNSNQGDMHELLYTYLVIQKIGSDVDGFDNDGQTWFKWNDNEVSIGSNSIGDRGKWTKIERPEETKHIMMFSPVG